MNDIIAVFGPVQDLQANITDQPLVGNVGLLAGTNITLVTDATHRTLTINGAGSSSNPTFNSLTLTTPLGISSGGTDSGTALANGLLMVSSGGKIVEIAGNVSAGSNQINLVADPTSTQDAATKHYVDTVAAGVTWKAPCLLATTTTLPSYSYLSNVITMTSTGTVTIDGSVLATGNRILVKNETSTNQPYNGIYNVTTAGAIGVACVLTRSSDYSTVADIQAGDVVAITSGTNNSDTSWIQTANVVTVGISNIVFIQWGMALSAGTGLSFSGSTLNLVVPVTIADGGTNSTTALNNGKLMVSSSGSIVESAITSSTTGSGNLVLATSPTLTGTPLSTSNPNPADFSAQIATDNFVQNALLYSMATVPLAVTGGTYSFASNGTTAIFVVSATSGVITSASVINGGTGYKVGDLLTIASGNYDSFIQVATVTGTAIATTTVVYGGTGYSSSFSAGHVNTLPIPFTYVLSGALSSNVTIVIAGGTYLLNSQQYIFCNNTTNAHTVTVKVSNGSDTAIGTGVVLPQGSNNSTARVVFTDGETDCWFGETLSGATPTITGTNITGLPLTTGVTGTLPIANGGTNSSTALNGNMAIVSSSSAIVEAAATTSTEIGYVHGVTSDIQTQINTKAPTASPTFTGTVTAPVIDITNTTNQLVLGTTNTTTISSTAPSASRTYTIPDAGTTANMVLDQGNYTIAGTWTYSAALTISPSTNQLVLGATRTVTISATEPASSSRVYTLPDAGAAANIVMDHGNYTISGTWTSPTFVTPTLGAATATTVAFSPTTGGIIGTTAADNAAAGNVGEAIRSYTTAVNAAGNGTITNLTSINLTAGDWDVSGVINIFTNGATISASDAYGALSAYSGTTTTDAVQGDNILKFSVAANFSSSLPIVIPTWRVNISGSATYYLKFAIGFSAGTPQALGRISARRVR